MLGTVFDIKQLALHDGPGLRTTVFLKGCPLRCEWCHNPEGLKKEPQLMYKKNRCTGCGLCKRDCGHKECKSFGRCLHICPENCLCVSGVEYTPRDLAKKITYEAEILGESFSGFTFSGGEPLLQYEFLLELIKELKGYNLCIETSGYADREIFRSVIEGLDYIIMDIKMASPIIHEKHTGVDNGQILENFQLLKESGKPYLIRTPLIPNITDTKENLTAIKEIIGDSPWEHIPFNSAWHAKYEFLE